jgi:hypothetical protein
MAYPESDTASSANYGPRSLAGSSQNRSTRELITPNGSPPRAPPPTPMLAHITTFPVYRDSIGLARARVSPGSQRFYRATPTSPPSPWPFRNATPRESMGSIDVSALSSYPSSMLARSVSDLSDNENNAGPVSPPGSAASPAPQIRTVTIDMRLPPYQPRSSSLVASRVPTPMPSPVRAHRSEHTANRVYGSDHLDELDTEAGSSTEGLPLSRVARHINDSAAERQREASEINRAGSQMTRGTTRLSQIPRMPTPDLANARTEFFNQPVGFNDSTVTLANNRVQVGHIFNRGLPPQRSAAAYQEPALDHRLALCVSGTVQLVWVTSFVATTTTIAIAHARGEGPNVPVIGWAMFNAVLVIVTAGWMYAVISRYKTERRQRRVAQDEEIANLRAYASQQAGEARDLDGQIELANLTRENLARQEGGHVAAADEEEEDVADQGHTVVRVLPLNGGRQLVRPGTPEPRAPPPTPDCGVHAAARQGGFLAVPANDEGVAPAPSEASILTQLCEGVMAGPPAAVIAADAADAAAAAEGGKKEESPV